MEFHFDGYWEEVSGGFMTTKVVLEQSFQVAH